MKLLVAVLMLFSLNSLHAEMVFMRETEVDGVPLKHIFLKKNNGELFQLTNGKDAHLYPDISSDGRSIVFVEGKIDPAGTDLKLALLYKGKKLSLNVMGLKGMILHPKFSRNGELLYFTAPHPSLKKNSIWYTKTEQWKNSTVDSLSVQATALDESEEQYFPRPSADGSFVVYQRNTGKKREIVLNDTLENTKTVIDEGMSPSLSFDENTIAYTSKKSGSWDIYEYNRVTKKISRRTFDESADEMAPTYNAANELIIASNKTGHFNLYKVLNYNWEQITSINDGDDYAPQFSGEIQYRQGTLAPFMEPLRSSFGTLNHEGKVYMCGGHQGPEHTYPKESFTDDFNVFDTATGKWKALAPRLHKAHGFQIAARGNYIYAFGGFAYSENHKPNWKSLDVIERYDISKNEWKVIGKMPRARSSNVAITLGDKVYLIGGWDSTPKSHNDYEGTFHSKIDIFDMRTETITEAPFTMPLPLRRAFTGLEHDGKLLLVGGLGVGASHFSLISKVTEIDPKDGSVFDYPELPFATFAPAAEKIGNELFVFGGMFKLSEMSYEYVPHIYGFDFNKNSWRHTGRYLKEAKGFSQVFKLDDSSIGILGGHRYMQGEDKPVNTFEFFTAPGSK